MLRALSAALAALGAVNLTTQILPRPVLAASTVLYLGVSLNLSCWWSAVWLQLQADGLASQLPDWLAHTLLEERPVDWLRRDFLGLLLLRCRQLIPILLLADDDLDAGLRLLPPSLRAQLEERGGLKRLLLPSAVRQLLEPWERGPDYLRVRPLEDYSWRVSMSPPPPPTHTITHSSVAVAAMATPRQQQRQQEQEQEQERRHPLPAPEWLVLYALRRHATRALRERLFGPPDATFASRARRAALAAAIAAALAIGARFAMRPPSRRRQLLGR